MQLHTNYWKIYCNPETTTSKSYNKLVQVLYDHYNPKPSVIVQRFKREVDVLLRENGVLLHGKQNNRRNQEEVHSAFLLQCKLHTNYWKIYCNPETTTSKSYNKLVQVLYDHYNPKPSVIVQRFKFNTRENQENLSLPTSCSGGAFVNSGRNWTRWHETI